MAFHGKHSCVRSSSDLSHAMNGSEYTAVLYEGC
jgi:hypothetical protein